MRAKDVEPGRIVYILARGVAGKKRYLCIRRPTLEETGLFLFVNSEKESPRASDFAVPSIRLGIGTDPNQVSIISCRFLAPLPHRWLDNPLNRGTLLSILPPDLARDLHAFCLANPCGLDPKDRRSLINGLRSIPGFDERIADAAE